MPRPSAISQAYPAPPGKRLQPPDDLTGPERAEFVTLVLALPADHFTSADLSTVAAYVRAVVAERRAAAELDAEPVIDGKPSPWNSIWQGKVRAMTTLARRLKLNPAGSTATKSEPEPIGFLERQRLMERRDDN